MGLQARCSRLNQKSVGCVLRTMTPQKKPYVTPQHRNGAWNAPYVSSIEMVHGLAGAMLPPDQQPVGCVLRTMTPQKKPYVTPQHRNGAWNAPYVSSVEMVHGLAGAMLPPDQQPVGCVLRTMTPQKNRMLRLNTEMVHGMHPTAVV